MFQVLLTPVKSKNMKNREAVARHKERKELEEARKYNTRSKGKTLIFLMYCQNQYE
jgi:hypothetical protein